MGTKLQTQLDAYRAYHCNPKNRLTHFFGIPLVTFAIFILFGWFRFAPLDLPLSAGTVLYVGILIYYLKLHRGVGIVTGMWVLPLFVLAEEISVSSLLVSGALFLVTFFFGMGFQLLGHYFEGKRPAFMDNFSQVLNGPLLLSTEALSFLGFKCDA